MKSQFISSRDIAQELIDGDRAALRATTVREDLQATRRRPLDAPMALSLIHISEPTRPY